MRERKKEKMERESPEKTAWGISGRFL